MSRLFSIDVMLAIAGTLAAAFSVIINQQWLADTRDAMTLLLDEQSANRHEIVQLADAKREAVRLRDLNILYSMLRNQSMDEAARRMILEQAVAAYETALISMARLEAADKFDETSFRIGNLATGARKDKIKAWQGLSGEFVRLFQIVDKKNKAFTVRQKIMVRRITELRNMADNLSTYSTYLQVFGLILVMLATIVGLKRIEQRLS